MSSTADDAWTEPSGYSREKFYTASRDKVSGDKYSIRVQLPGTIFGEMAKIVQSGIIPQYSTKEAMARNYINHGLVYDNGRIKSGSLRRQLNVALLLAEEDSITATHAEEKRLVQALIGRWGETGQLGRAAIIEKCERTLPHLTDERVIQELTNFLNAQGKLVAPPTNGGGEVPDVLSDLFKPST